MLTHPVIPAKAGIQLLLDPVHDRQLDPRLRGDDRCAA